MQIQNEKELLKQQFTYKQQNPDYKGQQLPLECANGPFQTKRCTDLIFAVLFIAFWAGLVVIAIIGFKTGNPSLLTSPFDSTGDQCGVSIGYKDFPYVYYDSSNIQKFTCINTCPNNASSIVKCNFNNTISDCSSFGIYPTTRCKYFQQVLTICVPTDQQLAFQISLGLGIVDQWISDMEQTWPILLVTIAQAIILSILVIILIRCCGGCIIWIVVLIYFLALGSLGGAFFYFSKNPTSNKTGISKTNLQIISYICWGILGISFIVLLCLCRKLKIAIHIIKTAAEFTQEQCKVIIVPFIMGISIVNYYNQTAFFIFWGYVSLYIFSSGKVTSCDHSQTPFGCIQWNNGVKRSLAYYFIGLFWNCQFAIALSQYVIASTAASWYFFRFEPKQSHISLCSIYCVGLFYHLGSLALGSLILLFCLLLKFSMYLLHYCGKEFSMKGGVQGCCIKCCIGYLQCVIGCFQRFIRFITKDAFMIMSITGDSFCESAHHAFYLVMRSYLTYQITHGLGDLIMFFGKLLVTSVATLCSYLMITQIDYFAEKIYEPFFPTLLFCVISFTISSLFMDVFGFGADCILMFYLVQMDVKRQCSKCPKDLRDYLQGN